jgi:hypothetical protein
MKLVSNVIAVSLFLSCAAHAGQETGALSALLARASGLESAAAEIPAAKAADAQPEANLQKYQAEKALASDVLDLSPSYADFLAGYAQSLGYAVFELDGARMTAKPSLLSYSTWALSLPGVPENWDAMIDLIGDLPAIHRNNRLLIVVRNSSRISLADRQLYEDFREVAEFACKNAREWSKGSITIKFAFVP